MAPSIIVALVVLGSTRSLELREALTLADRHPAVVALADAERAHAELDDELGLLTANPELRVLGGARAAPGGAESGPEFQVTLEQPVNLAGQAGARRTAAGAERAHLRAEAAARRLLQRLRAVDAWALLRLAERALQAAHEEHALGQRLRAEVDLGASRGTLSGLDLAEADTFAAELATAEVDAEGAWFEAELALTHALALSPRDSLVTRGTGLAMDVPSLDALLARVDTAPQVVARRRALEALARHDAELATERGPWLFAGAQWLREGGGANVVQLLLGLRAPIFDQGARPRAPLRVAEVLGRGELETGALDEGHLLAAAAHEVEHAREREAVLRDQLVPAAERLVTLRRRAVQVSESTTLELLQAERKRVAARGQLFEQEARRLAAEGRLHVLLELRQEDR